MQLQKPGAQLSAAIAQKIADYAADASSPHHRLAADHGVLALYYGWDMDFGLRTDGSVARFGDPDYTDVWYGHDEMDINAVAFGAQHHPEIKALFPERSQAAVDCESCAATGFVVVKESSVLCGQCHGIGWHT